MRVPGGHVPGAERAGRRRAGTEPGDEDRDGRVRRLPRDPAAQQGRPRRTGVASVDAGAVVEQQRRRLDAQPARRRRARSRSRSSRMACTPIDADDATRRARTRRRRRSRAGRSPARRAVVRAPGVLELLDHEAAGAGGRPPVDVPPVVARDVVAQRVERQVGVGQVARRLTLEVAQHARRSPRRGRRAAGARTARPARSSARCGAARPERVAAHRAHGADDDDGAPGRRDREELVVRRARAERRQREARRDRGPTGSSMRAGSRPAARGVAHLEPPDGALTDRHAAVGQVEVDRVRGRARRS